MGVAVVVLLLVRLLLLDTVVVTSDSMRPGLEPGDRLLVLRTAGIERGDVIVLDGSRLLGTDASTAYVKRVVGVPGDRVACCSTGGRIEVDGVPLDEPYVAGPTDQVTFDVTVPDDRYWVLGDNRSDSADSRAAIGLPGGGMVRASEVVGEVVWRYWPLERWGRTQEVVGGDALTAQTVTPAVRPMRDTAERRRAADPPTMP